MPISIQLITIVISFVMGFAFYYFAYINYELTKNRNKYFSFIIDLVLVIDFDFFYFYIIYKISYGMFHIYFFLLIALGYYVGYLCLNRVKALVKYCFQKIRMIKLHYRG
jgi:hypothetical protein